MRGSLARNIAVLLLVALCAAGCRRFVNPFLGDRLLARVADKTLYFSDVEDIFTPGITSQDSLKLLDNYVDRWVKQQLKIREAELRFPDALPDVERMVEDYRGSLLGLRLDDYWAGAQPDTIFSSKEIADYYEANAQDFLLDRSIVKGRIVYAPDDLRQRGRLKEALVWANTEQEEDFMQMCSKNNLRFENFAAWTDYADFLGRLPVKRSRTDEQVFAGESVQEQRDGGQWCYFIITARRAAGAVQPLERVEGAIRRVLAARRRTEIIRSHEDSLFVAAKARKQITINIQE